MPAPAKLKRGPASLFGGFAVGLCVLALWVGGLHTMNAAGPGLTLLGVLVAALDRRLGTHRRSLISAPVMAGRPHRHGRPCATTVRFDFAVHVPRH